MGFKECCNSFCRYTFLFFSKIFIGLNAIIFLAGAIFLIAAGSYANKQDVAKELNVSMNVLIGCISVAILLFGNFIIAIPIICYNDKIFSRLFALMTLVFAIVFFVYGGLVLKGRTYVYDYVGQQCNNPLGIFGTADRIHQIAQTFACTSSCPCNATSSLWAEPYKTNMVVSSTGINNITECVAYNNYISSESLNLDSTLGLVESYFQCSGICYMSNYYYFSSFALGQPTVSCVQAIEDYVNKYANILAAGCIIIGLFLICGVVGSIVIIYCIKYKHKINEISQYKYEIVEDNII